MLKLKNVSKFYYNKGIITSGFTKINADWQNFRNGSVRLIASIALSLTEL